MNYAAQVVNMLENVHRVEFYRKVLTDIDMLGILPLAQAIRESVHFKIPNNGRIFNDSLKGIRGERLNLPFPGITVEYFVEGMPTDMKMPMHSPKRLIYATHHGDSIRAWTFCSFGKDWLFSPISVHISSQGDAIRERGKKSSVHFYPRVDFEGLVNWSVNSNKHSPKYVIDCLTADAFPELDSLLELIEALTCSNVEIETAQKADPKINAKREKKGKLPLYETKILTIKASGESSRNGSRTKHGKTSPRQHLRRGHIRRLHDDRKIWVNSCVVGSGSHGKINKKYRVV